MASSDEDKDWEDFVDITSSAILNHANLSFDQEIAMWLGNGVHNSYKVVLTFKHL